MNVPISELSLMTETEKIYRIAERTLEMHETTTLDPETGVFLPVPNWKAALQDKWLLASIGQKGGN